MSKIEALIAKYCPDGVEWHAVGDIFELRNGYTPSKTNINYWANGTIPWFRMQDIRANGHILSESIQHITPAAIKGKLFPAYSIILATSATIGEHALITVDALANQRFTSLALKKEFRDKLDMYFFNHFCVTLDGWCKKNISVGNFASVDIAKLKKYQIPIPPLSIQREIVRILDAFTKLEAELEAELEARKKQYAYYSRLLLSFGPEVCTKKLGEIGKVLMCKRVLKEETSPDGDIPFYKIGTFGKKADAYIPITVFNEYLRKYPYPKKGEILISAAGTIGRTVIFDGTPSYFQDSNIVWLSHNEHEILNSFLFHIYKTTKWHFSEGGTIARLYNDDLAKMLIPLPPISEQERIVSILDRFEIFVNDLTQGLPAELAARRKQYEYYRDKLLTFRRKAS